MRAGAHTLSLLSIPLNVHVLQALGQQPRSLFDLRRAIGSPPQTTMRGHLRALTDAGIIERRRHADFPGSVDLELGRPGRDLMVVANALQDWLALSPEGSLQLGSPAAKSAVRALVEGWSTTIVRVLAARPLALTELSKLITDLTYPSLERRFAAMRHVGQIEPCPGGGRSRPYRVSPWLRRAMVPLAAAVRWERQYLPQQTAAITKIDVEAAFLLGVAQLRLPSDLSGTCRLAVETQTREGESRFAGVQVQIRMGRVTSCVARLEGQADAWVSGSAAAWMRVVLDAEVENVEIGGDCQLARALLDRLHASLFAVAQIR